MNNHVLCRNKGLAGTSRERVLTKNRRMCAAVPPFGRARAVSYPFNALEGQHEGHQILLLLLGEFQSLYEIEELNGVG